MHTLRTILDIIRHQRDYPGNEGSCFGVTDPSRLRPPFPRRVEFKEEEVDEEQSQEDQQDPQPPPG